ncbi:PIG-U-domain-containing protein [Pseudovirgaria hyperparasitica]|uniref:PIG-U-domain-containing protein n=1 Tax=Pseudovirgaria hyperparasitica TaxID=470096 RepID=A0A6A6VW57_9PEZI|nr:PIG-U-domain-containing protein [Pseudovirgaria hyperparasitica]KAF2754395.1 PIG-U-domain-containing protein [Pseudovirgaria hyperparasitica]
MSVQRQKLVLFGAAAAVRLLLFTAFPALPDILTGRVEVSTPVSSFKRLQEGLFLYNHNVSPYDGGVYHQAPLLLPIFNLLPNATTYPFFTNLMYIIVDLMGGHMIMKLAETGESTSSRLYVSPRSELRWSSISIGAGYLFSPFTLISCIARPTTVFANLFMLTAIAEAARGASATFILALSFASYISLHPILLFPPLAMLVYDVHSKRTKRSISPIAFSVRYSLAVCATIGGLLLVSYLLTGSWEFLVATYGVRLLLPDLTPNVGLWWYFFIEMFDSFRGFFLGVFWLHMASYVGGLSIRIRRQPLFVAVTMTGIFAVFQPYPSIADSALYLALVPLYRHVFPLMRYTFLSSAAIIYTSFLGPAFYHLWIYAGSGNANFFYAITLVWSLGLSVVVVDSIYAVLRDEWELERPEMKGQEVRMI